MSERVHAQAERAQRWGFRIVVAQFVCIVFIAVYFAVVTQQQNNTLAANAIAATDQNRAVIEAVGNELTIHGEATARRQCASAQELEFIILTGNKRAHKLHTGSYLTKNEIRHIKHLTDESCRFVPVADELGRQNG